MPIPGMRGMEHIGFTVPDINEACDFFERILGAEVLYTAATNFRVDDSDWMAVGQMVQIEGTFTPNKEHRAMYEEHHALYRGIYEAIANAGQYKGLANFSSKYF